MTWLENRSSPDRGVNRINTPRQEAFVMLNGVKHLRCVHVDVHEILRFCSGWHYTIIINLWQWITPLSYEKVLNYAIPWGSYLRGAAQLFSFTYAFIWNDLCIYMRFVYVNDDKWQMTISKNWNGGIKESDYINYIIYKYIYLYIIYNICNFFSATTYKTHKS